MDSYLSVLREQAVVDFLALSGAEIDGSIQLSPAVREQLSKR